MTIDDRELDRRLNALPRETQADEALWPGIERRLRPSRRWPAAAAVVAAVGFGALFIALWVDEHGSPDAPGFALREAETMRAEAPDAIPVSQINASPSLRTAWQDNQSAIDELETALERDPDNRLLLEFLGDARLRQARLIQRGLFSHERSI
jgi:hypothetical protein